MANIPQTSCPEIFSTIPSQPKEAKPFQLSKDQIQKFFDDGYIIVDKVFPDEVLQTLDDDIDDIVDRLAKVLYKHGKIKDLYADKGHHGRLIAIEKDFPGAMILIHRHHYLFQGLKNIYQYDGFLNILEQLLGTPRVQAYPFWCLRDKVPASDDGTVPWHQDSAYADASALDQMVITAWIPLIDSNAENGCCQVIKGGHKLAKLAKHTGCWKDTWYLMLEEQEIQDKLGVNVSNNVVTCEVPRGGALLFSNMMPHRSLPNTSSLVRWSVDIRFASGDPEVMGKQQQTGVVLRNGQDNFKIDWSGLEHINDKTPDLDQYFDESGEADTCMGYGYMNQWEMVNENRHTRGRHAYAIVGSQANPYHLQA